MKTFKNLLIFLGLFFLFVLGLNIYSRFQKSGSEIKYSGEYLKNINGNFITMSDKQQIFIEKNISQISKGISEDGVYKALGEPT